MTLGPGSSEDAFSVLEGETARRGGVVVRDTDVRVEGGIVAHAIDSNGRRHLLIPVASDYPAYEDLTSRGVSLRTHNLLDTGLETRYVDVACEVPSLRDLFSSLCDDMLGEILSEPDRPGPACVSVLERWRDLLAPVRGALMGRDAIAGLLAELHYFERLARHDPVRALQIWAGPDKSRHDFMGSTCSVEIKATTARTAWLVDIHGLTQLEPPPGGALYLRIERLESQQTGGDSVPDAIERLRVAGVPTPQLLRRVEEYGYAPADAETYRRCASLNSSAALILLTKVFRDLSGCRSCQRTR